MPNTPLTIRVPIRGQLLVKLDGFDVLHEVGAFTKELDVAISTAGGNVDFRFDPKFWDETIQGVGTPTPTDPGRSTYQIILKELEDGGVRLPEQLADKICHTLRHEGRIR